MNKKIQFAIDCSGLCFECENRPLFTLEAPDGWEQMSEDQKEEWSRDIFFEEMSWKWVEL